MSGDRPIANEAELHRAERCTELHAAILDGRTMEKPVTVARVFNSGKIVLEQFRCPSCGKLIERVDV